MGLAVLVQTGYTLPMELLIYQSAVSERVGSGKQHTVTVMA